MDNPNKGGFETFIDGVLGLVDGPVTWFRETVVEPNRPKYPYYHKVYRRVPTIDECEVDDSPCIFEAQKQWERDRQVDTEIMKILRKRKNDCMLYEAPNYDRCEVVTEQYNRAEENWFIKYGELGQYQNVIGCFFKQKHRLIWERRNPDAQLATPE